MPLHQPASLSNQNADQAKNTQTVSSISWQSNELFIPHWVTELTRATKHKLHSEKEQELAAPLACMCSNCKAPDRQSHQNKDKTKQKRINDNIIIVCTSRLMQTNIELWDLAFLDFLWIFVLLLLFIFFFYVFAFAKFSHHIFWDDLLHIRTEMGNLEKNNSMHGNFMEN